MWFASMNEDETMDHDVVVTNTPGTGDVDSSGNIWGQFSSHFKMCRSESLSETQSSSLSHSINTGSMDGSGSGCLPSITLSMNDSTKFENSKFENSKFENSKLENPKIKDSKFDLLRKTKTSPLSSSGSSREDKELPAPRRDKESALLNNRRPRRNSTPAPQLTTKISVADQTSDISMLRRKSDSSVFPMLNNNQIRRFESLFQKALLEENSEDKDFKNDQTLPSIF